MLKKISSSIGKIALMNIPYVRRWRGGPFQKEWGRGWQHYSSEGVINRAGEKWNERQKHFVFKFMYTAGCLLLSAGCWMQMDKKSCEQKNYRTSRNDFNLFHAEDISQHCASIGVREPLIVDCVVIHSNDLIATRSWGWLELSNKSALLVVLLLMWFSSEARSHR